MTVPITSTVTSNHGTGSTVDFCQSNIFLSLFGHLELFSNFAFHYRQEKWDLPYAHGCTLCKHRNAFSLCVFVLLLAVMFLVFPKVLEFRHWAHRAQGKRLYVGFHLHPWIQKWHGINGEVKKIILTVIRWLPFLYHCMILDTNDSVTVFM